MRLIKRYSNRRLYDTKTSRTITQFDLARLIEEGEEVRVVDSATGEDITVAILARVLGERSTAWGSVADATEVLRNIIYLGGNKSMSVLKNTILASIGFLQVTKDKAEKIIDDLIKKGELDKSERKKAIMELLDKADKSTASFRKRVLEEADKAGKSARKLAKDYTPAKQADLKKLNDKVNKLARKVKALEDASKPTS
jgi:polyhydroxyalkanoate synthesis repressor PhaR